MVFLKKNTKLAHSQYWFSFSETVVINFGNTGYQFQEIQDINCSHTGYQFKSIDNKDMHNLFV